MSNVSHANPAPEGYGAVRRSPMIPSLVLIALAQVQVAPLTLTPVDPGERWPTQALQPHATITSAFGVPRAPLVVWRDPRFGPWSVSAGTVGDFWLVGMEGDGEVSNPCVASSDAGAFFAWEVAHTDGGPELVACRKGAPASALPECPQTQRWPQRGRARCSTNGLPYVGSLGRDGGHVINLETGSVGALPVPVTAVDYSFTAAPQSPTRVFFQQIDGGVPVLSFPSSAWTGAGRSPWIAGDSTNDRAYVMTDRTVVSVSNELETPQGFGGPVWRQGGMTAFIDTAGVLTWRIPGTLTSTVDGGVYVDFSAASSGGTTFAVGEQRIGATHRLDVTTPDVNAQLPVVELVPPAITYRLRGSRTQAGDAIVAWYQGDGIGWVTSVGGTLSKGSQTGIIRDFDVIASGNQLFLARIDAAGVLWVDVFDTATRLFVNAWPAMLGTDLSRVTLSTNGVDLHAVVRSRADTWFGNRSAIGIISSMPLSEITLEAQTDCLWQGTCVNVWWDRFGAVHTSLPATLPAQQLLGVTHDSTGFFVIQTDGSGVLVTRLEVDGGTSTRTAPIDTNEVLLVPHQPAVLLAQDRADPTRLSVLRLDTLESTTVQLDAGLHASMLFATPEVTGATTDLAGTLLFDDPTFRSLWSASIFVGLGSDAGMPDGGSADAGAFDAGPLDAGEPDAGATDAGPLDAGERDAGTSDAGSLDAGTTDGGALDAGDEDAGMPDDGGVADAGSGTDGGVPIDGGTDPALPTRFAVCGCDSVPGAVSWLVTTVLFRRRRRR